MSRPRCSVLNCDLKINHFKSYIVGPSLRRASFTRGLIRATIHKTRSVDLVKSGRAPPCPDTSGDDGTPPPASGGLANFIAGTLRKFSSTLTGLGGIGLSLLFSLVVATSAPTGLSVTNEQLLFLEAWRAVDRAYVDKSFNGNSWFRLRERYLKEVRMDNRQETYDAIRSALAVLDDPFTRFLEPQQYAALKRKSAGAVTGVGLEVGFGSSSGTSGDLTVITPAAGGPAERAGIQPGDVIEAIDGRATRGISLFEAGDLLQGPEGSQIKLLVKKHNGGGVKAVEMVREKIRVNPVTSRLCEGRQRVGYIRVASFNSQTAPAVAAALRELRGDGTSRYVLDIRNNGGGLFPAGVEVARYFLPSGDIVLIADALGVRDTYEADGNPIEGSAPLVVLVNRGTASASEVLAGALQDNRRAKIAGERTFGKGLIQTTVELSDGSGLAITVARYQTPAGVDINRRGITPDVALAPEDMPPTDGSGFCQFVSAASAPPILADGPL
eukprot:jgi/Botrbrau1/18998/Bobra.0100s0032.1